MLISLVAIEQGRIKARIFLMSFEFIFYDGYIFNVPMVDECRHGMFWISFEFPFHL